MFPAISRCCWWCGLATILVLVAGGCATPFGKPRPEPAWVAIQNASPQDLQAVTVREVSADHAQPRRLGSVAPLLKGGVFTIRRRPNPVPLPDRVLVTWQPFGGAPQQTIVSIRAALESARGLPDEALFFRVRGGGLVEVAVDSLQHDSPVEPDWTPQK